MINTDDLKTAELQEFTKIQRVTLAPSDVVVLHCEEHLGHETAKRLSEMVKSIWPENKVVILDRGVEMSIVAAL